MATSKPIVVAGSINVDLVANAEHIPRPGETVAGTSFQIHSGGKGANQAFAVARLGYPVRMIGRVGEDAFGAQLRTNLESAGVDMAGVATSKASTGVAMIVVAQNGENSIVIAGGANALVTPQDLESNLEIIRSAGLVLTQLEIPVETVEYLARICARENVPLILDPAPATHLPPGIFKHIEWFTPNETEAAFFLASSGAMPAGLAREPALLNQEPALVNQEPALVAQMLLEQGPRGVILKMGSRGARMASASGLRSEIAPFAVDAVDTTAAGDAFNGAFATGLMLRMGPEEAARFAAAAAAISVTRAGAQPSMPRREEVERMMERGHANAGPASAPRSNRDNPASLATSADGREDRTQDRTARTEDRTARTEDRAGGGGKSK